MTYTTFYNRLATYNPLIKSLSHDAGYLTRSYWAYSIAYFLCVVVIFLDIKKYDFFKSPSLRSLLSFLHAADGIVALILALAFYYKSRLLLYGGVVAITKLFLLHLLSRMVTGEAAFGPWAITLQVITHPLTNTPTLDDPVTHQLTYSLHHILTLCSNRQRRPFCIILVPSSSYAIIIPH